MYTVTSPFGVKFPPTDVGVPCFNLSFQNDNRIQVPDTVNGYLPLDGPALVPNFPLTSFVFSIRFESGLMGLSAKNFQVVTRVGNGARSKAMTSNRGR